MSENEKMEALEPEEAIRAMLDGEILCYNKYPEIEGGICCWDTGSKQFYYIFPDEAPNFLNEFTDIYRRPVPKKRPMTRWECLAWVVSEKSHGWVVRYGDYNDWEPPQRDGFLYDISNYQRARLLPDLSGIDRDTICRFEIEESV